VVKERAPLKQYNFNVWIYEPIIFPFPVALAEHAADDLRLQTPLGNNEDRSEPTTPPPQEPTKVDFLMKF
jgi:hypothetical protein